MKKKVISSLLVVAILVSLAIVCMDVAEGAGKVTVQGYIVQRLPNGAFTVRIGKGGSSGEITASAPARMAQSLKRNDRVTVELPGPNSKNGTIIQDRM